MLYNNRALTYTSLGMEADAEGDVRRVAGLGADISGIRHWMDEKKQQRSQGTN